MTKPKTKPRAATRSTARKIAKAASRKRTAPGTRKIDRLWRPGHEGSFRKAGPLRHLYEGLY
jgi:hypothetical protein